jgi:hypothetical protein
MKKICLFISVLLLLPLAGLKAQRYYYIKSFNGKYLTTRTLASGSQIFISDFVGDDTQLWQIYTDNIKNDYYALMTRNGKVLDIPWNKQDRGTTVQLWNYASNSTAQRWNLEIISGDVSNTFQCYIYAAPNLRTLDFCNNNGFGPVYMWDRNGTDCQKWTFEPYTPPAPPRPVRQFVKRHRSWAP